ncbi:hypothetical protein [Massilia sp. MS-15]|uniref:protein kinase domain-containing protein n=1 Tax=Massilia sp. MS-15 TaxID=2878200 RepID=UPI001CD26D45|nr:hypothetical protein [Massilia sp. MS-15]MCA1246117.1 hypothetical protein [Massilia sp. MS-15]
MNPLVALDAHGRNTRTVRAGKELKRGGEGTIHADADRDDYVLKLFAEPTPERQRKVRAMLRNPPRCQVQRQPDGEIIQIAWPQEALSDGRGAILGFSMRRVDMARTVPLNAWYNSKSRERHLLSNDDRMRIYLARNLAAVMEHVHEAGHSVIDLKPENVLSYRDGGFVCLLDCDGFAVRHGEEYYPALVATSEYTAPELLAAQVAPSQYDQSQDLFALALLVFNLLDNGRGPAGNGPGVPESLTERFAQSLFYLDPSLNLAAPERSHHRFFPDKTLDMFRCAFCKGQVRPSAAMWRQHLEAVIGALVPCPNNGEHWHYGKGCPWCAAPIQRPAPKPLQLPAPKPVQLPTPPTPTPTPPPPPPHPPWPVPRWLVMILVAVGTIVGTRLFIAGWSGPASGTDDPGKAGGAALAAPARTATTDSASVQPPPPREPAPPAPLQPLPQPPAVPTEAMYQQVAAALFASKNAHWEGIDAPLARLARMEGLPDGDRQLARGANEQGLRLYREGNYAAAVNALLQGVAAAPADVETRHNLARAQIQAGMARQALDNAVLTIAAVPREPIAWVTLAHVRARQGEAADARAAMRTALYLSPQRMSLALQLERFLYNQPEDGFRDIVMQVLEDAANIPAQGAPVAPPAAPVPLADKPDSQPCAALLEQGTRALADNNYDGAMDIARGEAARAYGCGGLEDLYHAARQAKDRARQSVVIQ